MVVSVLEKSGHKGRPRKIMSTPRPVKIKNQNHLSMIEVVDISTKGLTIDKKLVIVACEVKSIAATAPL